MCDSVRGRAMKASSDRVRIYHYWGPCRDAEVRIEIGDLLNPEKIRIRESWDEHERDYVIRLERNGKLILKMKYEETPWFFYSDDFGRVEEASRRRRYSCRYSPVVYPSDRRDVEMLNALKAGERNTERWSYDQGHARPRR
jgi:hypothetical protein